VLTTAHKRILIQHFGAEDCPVCKQSKQRKWCFCRTCYFSLKRGNPRLASGLYVQAFNGTDEFFENYARAKEWLEERGHNAGWNTTPKSGDLFA
jgi:hypothetical protein